MFTHILCRHNGQTFEQDLPPELANPEPSAAVLKAEPHYRNYLMAREVAESETRRLSALHEWSGGSVIVLVTEEGVAKKHTFTFVLQRRPGT